MIVFTVDGIKIFLSEQQYFRGGHMRQADIPVVTAVTASFLVWATFDSCMISMVSWIWSNCLMKATAWLSPLSVQLRESRVAPAGMASPNLLAIDVRTELDTLTSKD